jgi:GNAT superfamily N-acetyltransferase
VIVLLLHPHNLRHQLGHATLLSFVAVHTHTQACAYLCNMAVDPQWRRKGIASYLLAAAEELSLAAGEL